MKSKDKGIKVQVDSARTNTDLCKPSSSKYIEVLTTHWMGTRSKVRKTMEVLLAYWRERVKGVKKFPIITSRGK